MSKAIIFLLILFNFTNTLSGQCPDKVLLWKRIAELRDQRVATDEQMKELQGFKTALENCDYRSDSTYAFLLQRIGVMYYNKGDYQKAIQSTREAITTIRVNYPNSFSTPGKLINFYSNLAYYYDKLNEVTEKNQALDTCIVISEKTKWFDKITMNSFSERVKYLFKVGDYHRCISLADLALNLSHLQNADTTQAAQTAFSWKINAMNILKEYDAAEIAVRGAIASSMRLGDKKYIGTLYNLLGNVVENKGNYPEAIGYLQKAYDLNLKIKYRKGCADALGEIGYIFSEKMGAFEKARPFYSRALSFANSEESINILGNLANLYTKQKKFDSAFVFYQRAFDSISVGTNPEKLAKELPTNMSSNLAVYVVGLVLDNGKACLDAYKSKKDPKYLKESDQIFESADHLINTLKIEQSEMQSRLFWRQNTQRLYEGAIESCFLSGDTLRAFYFFEKSRSVLLQDQLNELHLLSDNDNQKINDLRKNILLLENATHGNDSQSSGAAELIALKMKLDSLLSGIRSRNAPYYESLTSKDFITVNDLRKKIFPGHQAFVEIFNGDSSVYSLIVTSTEIKMDKIDKLAYDSLVRLYTSLLSDGQVINSKFRDFTRTAHDLNHLLFPDFQLPSGRIIVSPSGIYFPFESLLTQLNPIRYFIEDYAVSYTYSARYLTGNFETNPGIQPKRFLGMAPEKFSASMRLADLPGSEKSVEAIALRMGSGTKMLGNVATKKNFLNEFFRHEIVQLYTHASDKSNREEPVIYFADSALYLSELIPTNKPVTNLIILSACESGNGISYQGEGVFSFNRGFAAIGIPSSIMNLWAVDDQSTYKLTELFYKYASKGIPFDMALQKAKLEFMNSAVGENKLPYYWAPMVLAGRTDQVESTGHMNWIYVFLPIATFILLMLAWWYWYIKGKMSKRSVKSEGKIANGGNIT